MGFFAAMSIVFTVHVLFDHRPIMQVCAGFGVLLCLVGYALNERTYNRLRDEDERTPDAT